MTATDITLTLENLRSMLLAAQGLLTAPAKAAQKEDLLDAIQRMVVLQIDTISVVNRSPYFVLWSRLGDYDPDWLEALQADGRLFEYWAHMLSFIPIEDYGLYRRMMLDDLPRYWPSKSRQFIAENPQVIDAVMARIRAEGGLRSADFARRESDTKYMKGVWTGGWKVEKLALESLFNTGDLMVARRNKFQRVYDLPERIVSGWNDAEAPSYDALMRALVLKSVLALGAAPARWIPDYFRLPKQEVYPLVEQLAAEGSLLTAAVDGWDQPVYIHPDNRALLHAVQSSRLQATYTTLLSPFDPLVWDRERTEALFGFSYRLECYTPAAKRKYGYFVLPVLYRGALVARLDAKAHRKERRFEVKYFYLEPGVPVMEEMVSEISAAIAACARWHGTPEVRITRSDPPELAGKLADAVEEAHETSP